MAWIEFKTDTRALVPLLTRIADALDRAFPREPEPDRSLKPEDAVTYVDERAIAQREQAEEMNEVARWLREHPEFDMDEAASAASEGEPPRTASE
jgi:hypothetical protein